MPKADLNRQPKADVVTLLLVDGDGAVLVGRGRCAHPGVSLEEHRMFPCTPVAAAETTMGAAQRLAQTLGLEAERRAFKNIARVIITVGGEDGSTPTTIENAYLRCAVHQADIDPQSAGLAEPGWHRLSGIHDELLPHDRALIACTPDLLNGHDGLQLMQHAYAAPSGAV